MRSFLPDPPPQPARWKQAVQFQVERFLLRGAHYRLAFIAVLLGLVAVGGGLAVHLFSPGAPEGGAAVWWAFLRLTDPGYLGDDEGLVKRLVATVVTICGYVLFMGALIAIMTQWLDTTVRRLERGETPIAMEGHILLMGSASRVAILIEELLHSDFRLRRFLDQHKAPDLRIVVMTDEVDADFRSDLRSRLGPLWDEQRIILRSGSRLRIDHLERVDALHAAAILLPAGEEADESERDAATIKALLSIIHHPQLDQVDLPPRIVAEVKDHRLLDLVRQSYRGRLDLVPGDLVVGRFLAHTIRHPGLSFVLRELLITEEGNNLLLRSFPGLEGLRFHEAAVRFEKALLIGILRPSNNSVLPMLSPPAETVLEPGDLCVLLAEDHDLDEPNTEASMPPPRPASRPSLRDALAGVRRVLVLGWNAKVHDLLIELETYTEERYAVDLVSKRSVEEREAELEEAGYTPQRLTVRQLRGDSTVSELYRQLDVMSYDRVVFMGRGRTDSGDASDARTLLGYLALRAAVPAGQTAPPIVVELLDDDNLLLFQKRAGEVLLSSVLLSHVLAQVALRPELGIVIEELFTVGGAEFHFRPAGELVELGRPVAFRDLQRACWERGELGLGIQRKAEERDLRGGIRLNPEAGSTWTLTEDDAVLVLSTY